MVKRAPGFECPALADWFTVEIHLSNLKDLLFSRLQLGR